jgi:hypothetical protein
MEENTLQNFGDPLHESRINLRSWGADRQPGSAN